LNEVTLSIVPVDVVSRGRLVWAKRPRIIPLVLEVLWRSHICLATGDAFGSARNGGDFFTYRCVRMVVAMVAPVNFRYAGNSNQQQIIPFPVITACY